MGDFDHIPRGVHMDILKELPVRSLIRLRSVSKSWKSLIDSPRFIAYYNKVRANQSHHVLVSYVDSDNLEQNVSVADDDDDDDDFPRHQFPVTVPVSLSELDKPVTISNSQGLFCFYTDKVKPSDSGTAVIWNPTIRKSVTVVVPNVLDLPNVTCIGFGVCPHTTDPKLIKMTFASRLSFEADPVSCIPWQVEVFTLSSGAWRSLSTNLPSKSVQLFISNQVAVGRFINWLADDSIQSKNLIVSFDLITEEFTQVYLPDGLACPTNVYLDISKLNTSLVVLQIDMEDKTRAYGVWRMEHGIPNSFTKLFNISTPDALIGGVHAFRKNGEPIMEMINTYCVNQSPLVAYEPYSKHVKHIGIYGRRFVFLASSYVESLLLLDN